MADELFAGHKKGHSAYVRTVSKSLEVESYKIFLILIVFLAFAVASNGMRTAEGLRSALIILTIAVGGLFALWAAMTDSHQTNISLIGIPMTYGGYAATFFLANAISGGLAKQPLQIVAALISTYIFYFLVPRALQAKRERLDFFYLLLKWIAWINILLAALAVLGLHSIAGVDLINVGYEKTAVPIVMGLFEHQSILGLFLSMIALISMRDYSERKQLSAAILTLLCVVTIFLAQSRESILSVGLGFAIFLAPKFFFANLRNALLLLALLVGSAAVIYIIIKAVPFLSVFFRLKNGLSGREVGWGLALMMIPKSPWFGFGYNSAIEFKTSLAQIIKMLGDNATGAAFHNTPLTYAFETGLLALIFYLALFIRPIISSISAKRFLLEKRFALSMSCMIFLSDIWTDNNIGGIRLTSLMISILLGLACLPANQNQERIKAKT